MSIDAVTLGAGASLLVAASLQSRRATANLLRSDDRCRPIRTGCVYALAAERHSRRDARLRAWRCTVARPRARHALDTDRIAVAPGGNRFDYYADARWAETAPQMLQQNLVDALDGRRSLRAASAPRRRACRRDAARRGTAALRSRAAAGGRIAPVVHVQMQASLVDSRRAARVTSFVSEASVPASENRMSAVVAAFEAASAKVIEDVVQRLRDAPVSVDSPRPAKAAATP